jgi:hypothetical protein
MASWTALREQTVSIPRRATSFTVVCEACVQTMVSDGYGAAIVHGTLALERRHGRITCPNGHELRIERELAYTLQTTTTNAA